MSVPCFASRRNSSLPSHNSREGFSRDDVRCLDRGASTCTGDTGFEGDQVLNEVGVC